MTQRLAGGWSLGAGPPGAAVEVAGPGLDAARTDGALVLRTASATLRLEAPHWLAAFEIARAGGPPRLALAVPQTRAGRTEAAQVSARRTVDAPGLHAEAIAPAEGRPAPSLPKGWAPVATLDPG